jgi:hypothetical protein
LTLQKGQRVSCPDEIRVKTAEAEKHENAPALHGKRAGVTEARRNEAARSVGRRVRRFGNGEALRSLLSVIDSFLGVPGLS